MATYIIITHPVTIFVKAFTYPDNLTYDISILKLLILYCNYYSQGIAVFLISNGQVDSELLTGNYLTGYRVLMLGIVYLDQQTGAHHNTHILSR